MRKEHYFTYICKLFQLTLRHLLSTLSDYMCPTIMSTCMNYMHEVYSVHMHIPSIKILYHVRL